MATSFDLADVPAADAGDLAAAMHALILNGSGLVLLNGASDADLDIAWAALHDRACAEPQRALAAFVRFRHLVEVFTARRLQQLLLENGFALLAPALAVASSLRLNGRRGFNPQQFLAALAPARSMSVVALDGYRAAPTT